MNDQDAFFNRAVILTLQIYNVSILFNIYKQCFQLYRKESALFPWILLKIILEKNKRIKKYLPDRIIF